MADEQISSAAQPGAAQDTPPAAGATPPADTNPKPEATPASNEGTPNAKAEDGKTDKAASGAPEKYGDFKVPEGVTFTPDAALLTKFQEYAKANNLSQEAAQAAFELGIENQLKISKELTEAFDNTVAEWKKQAREDKLVGGENFDKNVAIGMKAIEKFGDEEFETALDTTGFGDHPALIRFLYKVGKTVTEGSIETPNGGGNGVEKSRADRLFG